jgi:transcriptional regulator with XRE-family HTH domain
MTALKRWFDSTGVTQVELETATGIDQALISKYARGQWIPGLRNALLIQKATGGRVSVSSWGDLEEELRAVKPIVLRKKAS